MNVGKGCVDGRIGGCVFVLETAYVFVCFAVDCGLYEARFSDYNQSDALFAVVCGSFSIKH